MQLKKRAGEDYAKYFYEKQALLNACNIKGRDAVSCIIGGLSEPHVKSGARAGNFKAPEDLFSYLRSLRATTTSTYRPSTRRSIHPMTHKRKHEVNRRPGACYKCSKPGHLLRDCPSNKNERRCYTCQETGHFAPSCPKRTKRSDTIQ